MKKTARILSIAALVAMGIMGAACSKIESPEIETPETQKENIVTLTTTVGFAADDTKALTGTGVKTFGAGDQMAVIYKNTSGGTVKAVGTLTSGAGTKSGTFTFTLTNPDKTQNVTYIYPAAMAGETDVDYTKLNSQKGTLTDLGSKYDLATNSGAWDGDNLPTLTLQNQLAILAINLKNSTDITSNITDMTISDGTNTYAVSRSAAAGPIYVAILPVASQNITVTATDGTKNYAKTLTSKTYAANNGYNVTWNMTDASVVSLADRSEGEMITVSNGQTITGTLIDEDEYLIYANITIEDGAIVTLKNVGINPDGNYTTPGSDISGITCAGNATIILEGTNTVNGFDRFGIKVKSGKTLTILGTGTLNASGYNTFSGIGGEGNIVINGGNITATGGSDGGAGIGGASNGSCGNITISGGTVTATGGNKAAGIGSGFEGTCGNITISGGTINATGGSDGSQYGAGIGSGAHCSIDNTISITITSGVVKVTATRGGDGGGCKFIGVGSMCSNEPTLTIDGVADATTSSTFPNFNSSVSGNTWTLTHK